MSIPNPSRMMIAIDRKIYDVNKLIEALRIAEETITSEEWVARNLSDYNGYNTVDYICIWCGRDKPRHARDCKRQLALAAIAGAST